MPVVALQEGGYAIDALAANAVAFLGALRDGIRAPMTGRRQPPRRKRERETSGAPRETSWERVATWYDGWVGDHGSAVPP